jgi:hypothetical protein
VFMLDVIVFDRVWTFSQHWEDLDLSQKRTLYCWSSSSLLTDKAVY